MRLTALLLLGLLPLGAQATVRDRERERDRERPKEQAMRQMWSEDEPRARWGHRSNPLQHLVSPREYEMMGLWRLDENEQARLAGLLEELAYRPPPPPPEPTVFKSRIEGRWRGFEEGVQIPLVNGQVWQQVERRTWELNFKDEPRITIQLDEDGAWYATVEGLRKRVRVKRIK